MSDTDDLLARIEDDLSVSADAMRSVPLDEAPEEPAAEADPFGPLIHAYTRADAIRDGALVQVEEGIAGEAGFRVPVALTQAAWLDCVAWSDEDNRQTYQDQSGRLWDVLFMSRVAAARQAGANRVSVELYRVPKDGRSQAPKLARLVCVIGPGDNGEPVVTIMQPDED
ncbi:DUF6573 family protein [Streptomyces wuyuanensis]|uniref:DUF6573 family protein n=1 Tax=Streptomyces wuyuanensis TaxID=1196353 RepID=UPI003717684C